MPGGKTHIKLWTAGAFPALGAAAFVGAGLGEGMVWVGASFAGGYVVGGLFGDPDLDVPGRTETENRALRVFGWPGYAYIMYWYPYGKLFRHGQTSHTPLLGLLSRVAYVGILNTAVLMALIVALSLVGWAPFSWMSVGGLGTLISDELGPWLAGHWKETLAFLGGWEAANLIHIVADRIHTERS